MVVTTSGFKFDATCRGASLGAVRVRYVTRERAVFNRPAIHRRVRTIASREVKTTFEFEYRRSSWIEKRTRGGQKYDASNETW